MTARFVPLAISLVLALAGCGEDARGHESGGSGGAGGGGAGAAGDTIGVGGVPSGGAGAGGGAGGAAADGITVDTPSGQVASESADGHCDILEAIAAATARRSVHECANPSGSTRILLAAGSDYPIARTLRLDTATERPLQIVVAGGPGSWARISAVPPWSVNPGDPTTGCLVHVSGGAVASLTDVTLTADAALRLSGACVRRGALAIRRGRVTGFSAHGLIATCLPEQGCDFAAGQGASLQIANLLVDGNASTDDGGGIYSAGLGANIGVYHSSIVRNLAASAGVLAMIDGRRSIVDVARELGKAWGVDPARLQDELRTFLGRFPG